MLRLRAGFTLIELLVVIAIIAIVAGIAFPVLARSRSMARKTACLSNFKQMTTAVLMYTQDYDETLPVPGGQFIDCNEPPPFFPNLLVTYTTNEQIWDCPEDPATQERREVNLCDDSSPPANRVQARRDAALHSDFALNWQYLGPVGWECSFAPGGNGFSTALSSVQRPAETIYAADSIWWRLPDGTPDGGGNMLVDPPCRYLPGMRDTFSQGPERLCQSRGDYGGWNPSKPLNWNVYGGVWPWHNQMVTTSWVDGHIKSRTVQSLTAGCDVQDHYGGFIMDLEKYLWDLN